MLTAELKQQLVAVASLGCDRLTSSRYIGVSLEEVRAAIEGDAAFAVELVRAEAQAELTHMKNIHQASKEEKNWRVSVWWLERRRPEQYAPRRGETFGRAEAEKLAELLGTAVKAEVQDAQVAARIATRIADVLAKLESALEGAGVDDTQEELPAG